MHPNLLRATNQLTNEDIKKLRESVLCYDHLVETNPIEDLISLLMYSHALMHRCFRSKLEEKIPRERFIFCDQQIIRVIYIKKLS